jgi:cobyrinic acid a,c-diamide synthase
MGIDDFFDDDLELEDYAIIGGVMGMFEDEIEAEKKRRKIEEEMLNPPDTDPEVEQLSPMDVSFRQACLTQIFE